MKNLLMLILMLGIFEYCFIPANDSNQPVKNHLVQADVVFAVDQVADPFPVPSVPAKWLDNHLVSAISGVTLIVYEFLALKLPTSKTVSIIGNLYKAITWLIPDRSKKGGHFKLK